VLLRVYAESANLQGVELRPVTDTTWRETTVTWTNGPAYGPVIATSGAISAGAWISFDVTAHVTADGPVTFALTSQSPTATRFSSRNGPNPPQLVISTPG
jgi:hypothetical protein